MTLFKKKYFTLTRITRDQKGKTCDLGQNRFKKHDNRAGGQVLLGLAWAARRLTLQNSNQTR